MASALRQGLAADRTQAIVGRLQALLSIGTSKAGGAATTSSSSISSPSHNVYPFIRLGAAKVLDVYYRCHPPLPSPPSPTTPSLPKASLHFPQSYCYFTNYLPYLVLVIVLALTPNLASPFKLSVTLSLALSLALLWRASGGGDIHHELLTALLAEETDEEQGLALAPGPGLGLAPGPGLAAGENDDAVMLCGFTEEDVESRELLQCRGDIS